MKIEEAIVYVMVKRNGGMTTDQIADAINRQGLHQRKDGQPVEQSSVCNDLPLSRNVHKRSRQDYVDDINVMR